MMLCVEQQLPPNTHLLPCLLLPLLLLLAGQVVQARWGHAHTHFHTFPSRQIVLLFR